MPATLEGEGGEHSPDTRESSAGSPSPGLNIGVAASCRTALMAARRQLASLVVTAALAAACRTGAGPATSVPGPWQGAAQQGSCPERAPAPPGWSLSSDAPLATPASWTGRWVLVPPDAPAGPVVAGLPCYEGLRFLTLAQQGAHVEAVFVVREPARGALMSEWQHESEAATGERSGDSARLRGFRLVERGSSQRVEVGRECHAVDFALAWDAARGHLVGTRDGAPVRYAPLVSRAPAPSAVDPCGAPPP